MTGAQHSAWCVNGAACRRLAERWRRSPDALLNSTIFAADEAAGLRICPQRPCSRERRAEHDHTPATPQPVMQPAMKSFHVCLRVAGRSLDGPVDSAAAGSLVSSSSVSALFFDDSTA